MPKGFSKDGRNRSWFVADVAKLASVICTRCGRGASARWGIDRNGRVPRQRYKCYACDFHFLEPREFPFGREFYSEPQKLIRASRLMEGGEHSLHSIAHEVGLDRYTIYKLHNRLGRCFTCKCGRRLGHRGNCDRSQSDLTRAQLNRVRRMRFIESPQWRVFKQWRDSQTASIKAIRAKL